MRTKGEWWDSAQTTALQERDARFEAHFPRPATTCDELQSLQLQLRAVPDRSQHVSPAFSEGSTAEFGLTSSFKES